MLMTRNIDEVQTNLAQIIAEVQKFRQPVIISQAGQPQVKIVPLDEPVASNRFGFLKDMPPIPDDFDAMNADEIAQMFGTAP